MENWITNFEPLLREYGKKKHPLDYGNRYQLLVMVILSAQDSDKHINELSVDFFRDYPSMNQLAKASIEEIQQHITSVRNFASKSKWLSDIAKIIGDDRNIPSTLAELTQLPGIGRKSANVIIRESGNHAEGIIVDLHVVRVAPRIGIATGDKPEKIEKQLMDIFHQDRWNEVGMAISFLGREICRPTNPKCNICLMKTCCRYGNSL
jgi:endonuclease III